jgi:hypothetical protein
VTLVHEYTRFVSVVPGRNVSRRVTRGTSLTAPKVLQGASTFLHNIHLLLLHCLTRTLIVYRTSVSKFLRILNIHRVRPLGVNPLIVHRRSALVRRPIVDALPSILIAPANSTQAEACIVGIAALGSTRAGSSGDGCRQATLGGGVGAAVATVGEEMTQCRDRGCEAADAGLDVGAQDDVGDPERQVRLRLEFVDEGDADHRDDRCQRGEGKQSEGLNLGLSLHLRVPQNDGGNDDKGHVGQDGRDGRSVCDNEECFRGGTMSLTTQNQSWCPCRMSVTFGCRLSMWFTYTRRGPAGSMPVFQ